MDKRKKRRLLTAVLVVLASVAGIAGITAWYKLYREVPQPAWIRGNPRNDFLYGSVGAETTAGMPYWVWLVLPRICKGPMRGQQGGYAALGRPWDQGVEMPAGFSKKTVGYVRVAGNCALCHATSRMKDGVPVVAIAGPRPATDVRGLLAFYTACAQDPHFNADEILSEIAMATKLSFVDRLLYRYVLIPRTRHALLDRRKVLIDPALRRHSRNPQDPFTDERLQALAAWLREQRPAAAR